MHLNKRPECIRNNKDLSGSIHFSPLTVPTFLTMMYLAHIVSIHYHHEALMAIIS